MPFMKEIAQFYLDFLEVDADGQINAVPSHLPVRLGDSEQLQDKPIVAKNSALDMAVAKHFLTNIIQASNLCGVYANDIPYWQELLDKIPDYQVASDGTWKEFINSAVSLDYSGISVGTLYPVYYWGEVNMLTDKAVVDTYIKTADKKLSQSQDLNSFTLANLATTYARLGDKNKAEQCLTDIVRACALNNLALLDKDWRGMGYCGQTNYSPIQLQSNLAFANAVQQMILFSHGKDICILPATPQSWQVNCEGLLTDDGVEVNLEYDDNKGVLLVEMVAPKEQTVNIYLPSNTKKLLKNCTKTDLVIQDDKKYLPDIKLSANKRYSWTIKLG